MGGRKQGDLELKKGLYIIGEGLTEQYYFTHLKHIKKYNWHVKPRFFGKTDIAQIDKTVKKLLLGGVSTVCVFDADVSARNEKENEKLEKFKREYENEECVLICDSLPSIEFWFLLHFVRTSKHFRNSSAVENELKRFLTNYSKSKNYLENRSWVEELTQKLNEAIENAKSIDSQSQSSYSNIYKLLEKEL